MNIISFFGGNFVSQVPDKKAAPGQPGRLQSTATNAAGN
jgi:hypothetical protein